MGFNFTKKTLIITGTVFVLVGLLTVIIWLNFSLLNESLEVNILNVGQGDSVLIKTPAGQNILVDGGPDKKVLTELGKHLPWWDRKIDLMILTHGHDDHLLGLLEALKHYKISKALSLKPDGVISGGSWQNGLREQGVPLTLIEQEQIIDLGNGAKLEVVYPLKDDVGVAVASANNDSIILKLSFGKSSLLMTGDAEFEVEKVLIESGKNISATAIKIGHHGSDNSTTENFLQAVKPDVALISVGAGNTFGHPSRRVLKRLERDKVKVYRTDQQGTITLTSKGDGWTVKGEN